MHISFYYKQLFMNFSSVFRQLIRITNIIIISRIHANYPIGEQVYSMCIIEELMPSNAKPAPTPLVLAASFYTSF